MKNPSESELITLSELRETSDFLKKGGLGKFLVSYRRTYFKVCSPVADEIWSAKFKLGLNLMNFDVFRFGNGTAMSLDEA